MKVPTKLCFWTVTGFANDNIGDSSRQKIADAASDVQQDNQNVVLLAVSCGGKDDSQGPEIALLTDLTNYLEADKFKGLITTLTESLNLKLSDQFSGTGLSPKAALQNDVRYKKETHEVAQTMRASFNIRSARKLHATLATLPSIHAPLTLRPRSNLLKEANVVLDSALFSITESLYTTLTSTGSSTLAVIKQRLDLLQQGFDKLAKEPANLNAVAVLMASHDIVTIGPQMQQAYDKYTGSAGNLADIIAAFITSCEDGLSGIRDIVQQISQGVGSVWGASSDALNLLLVVNGQQRPLTFSQESILHGEDRFLVSSIPAAPATTKSLKAYPCALYAFQKATKFGNDWSYYGSSAGLTLQSGSTKFSIGLCSPSTVLGGKNTIRLFNNSGTANAAKAADTSASRGGTRTGESISLNGGTCVVNRANDSGNLNYCLCTIKP